VTVRAPWSWDGSEWTVAGGRRIHAAIMGPAGAPEVVLVHGLGCSHRYLRPLAHALVALDRPLRAVAVDLPGFGRTPGPRPALDIRGLSTALGDWLEATGRSARPLVANSMGCQVVIDLAAHSPELLGPTVLIGPTMDRHARSAWKQAMRLSAHFALERPSLLAVLGHDYLIACGPRRFFATLDSALADRPEDKAALVPTPSLVVRGTRDVIVPHSFASEIAERMPRGRLVEVRGGPHALNYTTPGAVARLTAELVSDSG
jgi:pimeloyl-ACP methyl ester carboxylesterase